MSRRFYTQEELDYIAVCTLEGMPTTWIAETLERRVPSVQEKSSKMPGAAERAHEWHVVWPTIMNNSILLELHREFAPQGTRYSW